MRPRWRRGATAVAGALLVGAIATAAAGGDDHPPFVTGARYTGDFPDPFVIVRADSTYLAFGTNTGSARIPMLRSTDLRTWYSAGDVLANVPDWAEDRDRWAPSVARIGGRWLLFYAVPHAGLRKHCISAAVGPGPEGPFVDVSTRPVTCPEDGGSSIDPSPFVDVDGTAWLLWKTEPGAGRPAMIRAQRLVADGSRVTGPAVELLRSSQRWEGSNVENPSMLRVAGFYVLAYSGSDWRTSRYGTGIAYCLSPAGPCVKSPANPVVRSQWPMLGPGGGALFVAHASVFLAHHHWTGPDVGYPEGTRRMRIVQLAATPYGFVVGSVTTGAPPVVTTASFAPSATGRGYLATFANGAVAARGDAPFHGSLGGRRLNAPVIDLAPMPDGSGYWLLAQDGGIFSFGDARFHGSTGGIRLNQPIVGMAPTPTGRGYWLVARDGGIFTFGDGKFYGSVQP